MKLSHVTVELRAGCDEIRRIEVRTPSLASLEQNLLPYQSTDGNHHATTHR
jgi:hypothetical protein